MSNNGVIRIGRKGLCKFAFGADGEPFEIDVVSAFQDWVNLDDQFRDRTEDRTIANADMQEYHKAAFDFASHYAGDSGKPTSVAEALDFLARLREQYDEMVSFFRPRSRERPDSPTTTETELRFSAVEN